MTPAESYALLGAGAMILIAVAVFAVLVWRRRR